jgi:hypothetical protein
MLPAAKAEECEHASQELAALPVCLWRENPNRLVSLWSLMQKFEADMCCGVIAAIMEREQAASTSPPRSNVPGPWIDRMKTALVGIKLVAVDAGLVETAAFVDRIHRDFGSSISVEKFMYSLSHLRELMESEMKKQLFLSVPQPLAHLYEQEKPMGDSVYSNFASARLDISEAGSCLACGRNNAAMHHLMLAVEVGLRELGKDRQIPSAISGSIDFKQWGQIIKELEISVAAIQQWPNSEAKDDAHKFYNSTLSELRAFNDGWRRHLAHARSHKFADTEALALWEHVERFFTGLSSKISEGNYTLPVWM